MFLLIVTDALNVGLVGENESCAHEARIFGQHRRSCDVKDFACTVAREVIDYKSSNRCLAREGRRKSLLDGRLHGRGSRFWAQRRGAEKIGDVESDGRCKS